MNMQQRSYAFGRIAGVVQAQEKALRAAHTKAAKRITDEERAELVRSGKVKLKASIRTISTYTDVDDAFDFSKFVWDDKLDLAAFDKAFLPIKAEADRVRDQIMLGDSTEALQAIEAFAAKFAA